MESNADVIDFLTSTIETLGYVETAIGELIEITRRPLNGYPSYKARAMAVVVRACIIDMINTVRMFRDAKSGESLKEADNGH